VALVPFASVDTSALRWIRTRDKPIAFSLRAGDAEVATLSWERVGGSLAVATAQHGSWTLKRAGFLQPTVLVRSAGSSEPVARLSAHLSRHEVNLAGGPSFRLRHVSHIVPSWRLSTDRGVEVLHVEPVAEHRQLAAGAVVVTPGSAGDATLLLVVLTWYFVVLSWFEDEAIEALTPLEGSYPPVARGDPS